MSPRSRKKSSTIPVGIGTAQEELLFHDPRPVKQRSPEEQALEIQGLIRARRRFNCDHLRPLFHWPPPTWIADVDQVLLLVSPHVTEGKLLILPDNGRYGILPTTPPGYVRALIIANPEDVKRASLNHDGLWEHAVGVGCWEIHPRVLAMLQNSP